MFSGTKITIDGVAYICPAISLGQLRGGVKERLQEHDKMLADSDTFGAMVLRSEVIFETLQRNYPDIDKEKVMAYLDMKNIGPIWLSILGQSGFDIPGEEKAAETVKEIGT